jgi:hypothetical protein
MTCCQRCVRQTVSRNWVHKFTCFTYQLPQCRETHEMTAMTSCGDYTQRPYMASRRAPTDSHSRLMERLADPVLLPRQRSDPRDTPKEFSVTVSITTLLSCDHLKKMRDSLIVKKFLVFMQPEGSLPCLVEPAIGAYLEPVKSSQHPNVHLRYSRNFLVFYATRRFITVLTKARYWTLS